MEYDSKGRELPDQTPMELPIGFKRPPTMQEMIMASIRTVMSDQAEADGFESFAEADDFDDNDDELPFSPHELTEMQEEIPSGAIESHDAGKIVVDKAGAVRDNGDAPITEHKESKNGASNSGRKRSDVKRKRDGDGEASSDTDGEVNAAVVGKGGSA